MKKRFLNLFLAMVLFVCALPVVVSASSIQATERNCNILHYLSTPEKVEVLEAGTCQTKGYVKYKCTAGLLSKCNNTWIQEEFTVTCHTSTSEAKDATCTEPGNAAGIVCTDCGTDKSKCAYCAANMAETIPATGHTSVAIPDVEAKCSSTGSSGGTRCSVCDTTLTEPTVIPATGTHNYTVFVETIMEPNCTYKGKDLYKCNGCDATSEIETTDGKCIWQFVRYKENNVATCSDDGVGVFQCKYCDAVSAQTVYALGHDRQIDVIREATCTKDGWQEVTCGREGCGYMIIEKLEATGHTEVPIAAVSATCTATGLAEGVICSVCQKILTAQSVTAMVPHTFETPVAEQPATCLKDGYTAHMKCNFCDATEGKEEIDTDGHNFVNFICSKCGVRDGSCLHSNAQVTVVAATCKAAGKETFNCSTCGYNYENTLPQLTTHTFVNGTCSVCGSGSNKCPNHNMVVTDRVEATCTTEGYETKICEVCGEVKTNPLTSSHNFVNQICTKCGAGNTSSNQITIDLQDIFVLG